MSNRDLVTVITPVYNSKNFLPAAIESVLSQSYEQYEYILVDDASTDNSRDIIRQYAKQDSRISYVFLNSNGGAPKARNAALNNAKGAYVAFLDSDDFWLKEKTEKQVCLFGKNSQLGLIGTNGYLINENGERQSLLINKKEVKRGKVSLRDFIMDGLPIVTSSVMARRECFDICGFFKNYPPAEDYEMWMRIINKFEVDFIDEPLMCYRRHNQNITRNKIRGRQAKLFVFENEILNDTEKIDKLGQDFLLKIQKMYCSLGKMYIQNGEKKKADESLNKALHYKVHPLVTLKTLLYKFWNKLY